MKEKLILIGYYTLFLFTGALYLYFLCWLFLEKVVLSGLVHAP